MMATMNRNKYSPISSRWRMAQRKMTLNYDSWPVHKYERRIVAFANDILCNRLKLEMTKTIVRASILKLVFAFLSIAFLVIWFGPNLRENPSDLSNVRQRKLLQLKLSNRESFLFISMTNATATSTNAAIFM